MSLDLRLSGGSSLDLRLSGGASSLDSLAQRLARRRGMAADLRSERRLSSPRGTPPHSPGGACGCCATASPSPSRPNPRAGLPVVDTDTNEGCSSAWQQVDRNHFQIRLHADGADACASSSRSMSCPTGQAPNEDACPPEGLSRAPMHVARDPRPHTFERERQPHTHERDPRPYALDQPFPSARSAMRPSAREQMPYVI